MASRTKHLFWPGLILLIVLSIPTIFVLKLLVGRGFAESIFQQTIVITDVTKPQTIIIRKRFYQGCIDGMSIHCSGFLDGNAKIQRYMGGGPYNDEDITGKVRFKWGGDWYSDTAEIRYIPNSVIAGQLTLTYTFYD